MVGGGGGGIWIRETREGWPLLTVETEANGDSKSTNVRVHPWLVHWALRADTLDFLYCLSCSGQPITNISSTYTISIRIPIVQQLGQAAVQGRLPLNVRLRFG